MAAVAESASSANDESEKDFRLGYVTDVEGNLDYFQRYVELSNVLTIRKESSPQNIVLDFTDKNNNYFVYGGDTVDKGPGDIRLVRALVDFKRRYPDRVYLLVGNRDLNKLRFSAELADDDMNRPMEEIPPPHWDPKAPSLLEYLTKKATEQSISVDQLNTRVNRLHYMLEHTLGCPKTFDFRRQELAILRNVPSTIISDEDILQSFLDEVEKAEGSLRQYLECANVAVILGNTLFCHGAVDANTMKFVPRDDTKFENPLCQPPAKTMIESARDWTLALNQYLKVGLQDYQNRPYWNDDRTSRGGESLMALQNRPAMWGRSIVSNCYGDGGCITTESAKQERLDPDRVSQETTNPLVFEKVCSDPMDPDVAKWLLHNNIQRVVVGHKPTGDCPAVLSATYTGVEIVSADTSFSDAGSIDNRGQALSVVELVGTSKDDNQLQLRGVLRNGKPYSSQFPRLHSQGNIDTTQGDENLGRQLLHDGNYQDDLSSSAAAWWIKVATEDSYWLTRGKGRHVEYKEVPKGVLETTNKT